MVDDCHKLGMLPCASRSFFEHARTRTAFRACEENTMPACEMFLLLPCCSTVLEFRANEAGLSHFKVTPNLPSSLTHAARKLAKCIHRQGSCCGGWRGVSVYLHWRSEFLRACCAKAAVLVTPSLCRIPGTRMRHALHLPNTSAVANASMICKLAMVLYRGSSHQKCGCAISG